MVDFATGSVEPHAPNFAGGELSKDEPAASVVQTSPAPEVLATTVPPPPSQPPRFPQHGWSSRPQMPQQQGWPPSQLPSASAQSVAHSAAAGNARDAAAATWLWQANWAAAMASQQHQHAAAASFPSTSQWSQHSFQQQAGGSPDAYWPQWPSWASSSLAATGGATAQQLATQLPAATLTGSTELAPAPPASGTAEGSPVEPQDAALNQEISSAVTNFLAGEWSLEESDEEGDAPDSLGDTGNSSASTAPTLAPTSQVATSGSPRKPEQPQLQADEQISAGHQVPENIEEYLSELRRRPLPPEITDDKMKKTNAAISAAILSLYRDRIRPAVSVVQRRLRERQSSEVVVQALLSLCAREPGQYRVLAQSDGEQLQINLAKEPVWFEGWVDFDHPDGNYKADVWEALTSFLEDENVILPGKPHLAAAELRGKGIPVLESMCLGELEHVVRIGLRRRRLLAMEGNCMRPAHVMGITADEESSTDGRGPEELGASKPSSASAERKEGKPGAAHETDGKLIENVEDLTVVLLNLMRSYENGISLASLKHALQAKCGRALNEAHLKCMKLSDVFKLQPLAAIFPLKAAPHGSDFLVEPPIHGQIPQNIWNRFYHMKSPMVAMPSGSGIIQIADAVGPVTRSMPPAPSHPAPGIFPHTSPSPPLVDPSPPSISNLATLHWQLGVGNFPGAQFFGQCLIVPLPIDMMTGSSIFIGDEILERLCVQPLGISAKFVEHSFGGGLPFPFA